MAEISLLLNDIPTPSVINFLDQQKGVPEELSEDSDEQSDSQSYGERATEGTVIYGELGSGFGTTIGNAMRRVLLSSLRGCAIVAFSFEGAPHEFAKLEGVHEDITKIGLNFKRVKLGSIGLKPFGIGDQLPDIERGSYSIEVSGPTVVTAEIIEKFTQFHVANRDLQLFRITSSRTVRFKIYIAFGFGYCPSQVFRKNDERIGVIYLDALFSPIEKVAFKIEETSFGSLPREKLILDVKTNGTIGYRDAVIEASRVLIRQVSHFDPCFSRGTLKFDSESKEPEVDMIVSKNKRRYPTGYFKKLSSLELPIRAANAFARSNIIYLGDLLAINQRALQKMPNLGKKSIDAVQKALQKYNCSFDSVNQAPWPPPDMAELCRRCEAQTSDDDKIW